VIDSAAVALHPRPRLTRPRWMDLNGPWQFGYDDTDQGLDHRWQIAGQGSFDRTITVPFPPESTLSGIADTGFHPVVWYRRTFNAAPDAGGRLLLHFGAVDYRAQVWVNGELVAEHEGGHTPFSADITASLVAEGEQVVVVRAEDPPGDVTQPRGKQEWLEQPHSIWYHRTTGIWQAVWLEPVPATHIAELQFTPDIASASVKVEALFNRASGATLMLTLRASDAVLARQYVAAQGTALETVVVIPALRNGVYRDGLLWTPDKPNLISVTAQLVNDSGEEIDAVESYFGIRTTSIGNGRFLLNDRPVFVRSVLEQGYWPQSHLAAPSADALRDEVELIKSLGFNAVRIHQKVEDPRFLYWADHLGLMVWGEMANAFEFSAPAVDKFTREWLSAVRRDRSHPSIVTWTPLNESWGVPDIALSETQQHYASGLYHLTKALDPSRPVISNDGWEHTHSDIWGLHDYTQYPDQLKDRYGTAEAVEKTLTEMRPTRKRLLLDPTDRRGQPVMITEFGGLSYYPAEGKAWFGYATAQSEDEYLSMMKGLFDAIYASPDIAGFCYTQITDTLQETNGLLDENRRPKLPVEKLRDIIWQPSRAVPSEFLDIARQKALRTSAGQVV
jgi:beta-galactosidase/beta-glucuronidase